MNNQQEQNTIEIEGRLFIITEAKITLKQSITTHKHPRLPRATKTATRPRRTIQTTYTDANVALRSSINTQQ